MKVRLTLTNLTRGGKYSRTFETDTEVNRWINWVQVDDADTMRNCPDCKCRILIQVEDVQ